MLGIPLVCIATKRKKIAPLPQSPAAALKRTMRDVPSPCTGVCRIDEATGWCRGCRRTLKEIADWPMLAPREKRAVLRRKRS
ncbi:DUF1289 domain-containing protein [Novosphingobium sp. H3SJ31-1]|uniref:DUF1289 domain-containing protein n=2 Tax=Novosphingobium album (ex Liu et al. 2023) TaxID=3031130 RepID=A0ABT5WVC3_9SPHN|nr:DUF1289 domain-containing protein [Novosphingobium album (ex Liu et al. 2023)]